MGLELDRQYCCTYRCSTLPYATHLHSGAYLMLDPAVLQTDRYLFSLGIVSHKGKADESMPPDSLEPQ
jgi:hypothetical protein